jgi:glucan 1,3-beta-glucosidase
MTLTHEIACSDLNAGASCQSRIFSIEGAATKRIGIYNLNTIGSQQMATIDGTAFATFEKNQNVYPQTVALLRTYNP